MKSLNRYIRTFVPSAARLSYNPIFRVFGDLLSSIPSLIYPEFRNLPPNHLRVRVGVNNQVLFNQVYHLTLAAGFWMDWLSAGHLTTTSDVVEIGCGCGRIAHHLRGEWFKGSYVGVDIDQEMLEWSAAHFPAAKFSFMPSPNTSKTYSAGAAVESAPFVFPADWKKDFIYSTSLYTHLLEREMVDYTRESFRILRPGGTMYMSFFCLDTVKRGDRWTFRHKIGDAYVENLEYPEAAVAYTRDFMENLGRSAGFGDVRILANEGQSTFLCRK